jgi:hypothetical protein
MRESGCVCVCVGCCCCCCCCCFSSEPYYVVICGLSRSTMLSHERKDTGRKKLLNTKCVFRFSLKLTTETFLMLTRTEWGINHKRTSVCVWSVRHSCQILVKPECYRQLFGEKYSKHQLWRIPVQWGLRRSVWTDGQTWQQPTGNSRNFSNATKNVTIIIIIIICHGVGPLVDPFRSHVPRSPFKALPSFLLPVGE